MSTIYFHQAGRQRGAAAVEFAIVSALFFILLFGIMEMGRVLYYWNTATEATRLGARIAVVCDLNDSQIKDRMQALFPILGDADIDIDYQPSGCVPYVPAGGGGTACTQATVNLQVAQPVQTIIPFLPMTIPWPAFSTTLPRESLASTFPPPPAAGGIANPVCG